MSFARLPNPPPGYDRGYFERLLNELNLQFRDMHNTGPAVHTSLQLTALPTSSAGLREGDVWLDTGTGDLHVVRSTPYGGWRDLVGYPTIRVAGVNDPTWDVYRGTIRQFKMSQVSMTEMWFEYHVDHDYKLGSDMYIHTHWSQIVVDTGGTAGVPGVAKWYFDVTAAKGHQQQAFAAPVTMSVTQQASTTQYMHNIAEVQMSAASPSASQLDSDNIETDMLILVRIYRDPADVADTLNQAPFLHTVDIHYQSDHDSTPNKAPPFV